jgi:hypothetical protein
MAEPIRIPKHPRWDGTNITWEGVDRPAPHEVETRAWSERRFPLQDLLRTVGQDLDELGRPARGDRGDARRAHSDHRGGGEAGAT